MRWQGRKGSSNINDARGRSGGGGMFRLPSGGGRMRIPTGGSVRPVRSSGMGFGTLIIIGVVMWLLGMNPLQLIGLLLGGGFGGSGIGGGGYSQSQQMPPELTQQNRSGTGGKQDKMKDFMSVVLGSTEEVWDNIFNDYGRRYPHPKLNLFSGSVRSACGLASSASGPFYCPADQEVYIDLSFYQTLARQFGASGDFAFAYVLAHEVGHHVQNQIGVLPEFNRMRKSMGKLEVNKMSVKVELQADCFAGIWGHYVERQGWLEEGDLEEALNAAVKIGDDAIQKRTQGYVVPDAFNHGSSAQRKAWFKRGFDSGRIESCNTLKTNS